MFNKVLVANRGEIAVRIVRACRDMGIASVALYDASDRSSLHVRLADECVELTSPLGYLDGQQILDIAHDVGAEAIHPGYGFLAERADFVRACEQAGVTFIGPPSDVVEAVGHKLDTLDRAKAAGFATPAHSSMSFGPDDMDLVEAEAEELGYPLMVKSCSGGRGKGGRMVRRPDRLSMAVRQALAESQMTYGSDRIFMERAILPANFVDVQLIGDDHGTLLHLGTRDGSIQFDNQKLLAESPAPCLSPEQQAQVCQMALTIARLFDYQNAGTVEFLMGADGTFYFAEIKARIQVEHPVTEMVTGVDMVREQIEIAAGKRITTTQEQVKLTGWAMQCRLNARDPWNNYLPSPGHLRRFRLPGGPNVRVDTYAYSGCEVPVRYDPMLAKVAVWGEDRDECVMRMRRALQDFAIGGIQTDLPLFQRILEQPGFVAGRYDTQFLRHEMFSLAEDAPEDLLRDLATAAAIAYLVRYQSFRPVIPDRLRDGWHRSSRQIPG